VQAGLSSTGLPSEAEAASPLHTLGRYLRGLATGPPSDTMVTLATSPTGLLELLPQLIAELSDTVRKARGAALSTSSLLGELPER
jgi:hypothetical protein